MWRLNGCSRCHGDMALDQESEWHCLQCGHVDYASEPPSGERWKNRSRTYLAIAQAMAEQWG